MSSNELVILFGLSYEVTANLLMGVGLLVLSVGITAALMLTLFALARRFFNLRRGPEPGDNRAEQGFVLEWLR